MNKNIVIVSQHPAGIEFIAAKIAPPSSGSVATIHDGYIHVERHYPGAANAGPTISSDIKVLSSATPADVLGKIVWGNVPLHLASFARLVCAVEFDEPPRGKELDTLADMIAAGARISRYKAVSQQVADEAARGECVCPICGRGIRQKATTG